MCSNCSNKNFFHILCLLQAYIYIFEYDFVIAEMLEKQRYRQDIATPEAFEVDDFIAIEFEFIVLCAIYQLLCFIIEFENGISISIQRFGSMLRLFLDSMI